MMQIGRTIGNYSAARAAVSRLLKKSHVLPFPSVMVRPAALTIQARYFSNEDFKKTLNDIKSKQDEKASQEEGETSAEKKESPSSSEPPKASFDASAMFGSVGSLYESFVDNVKLAYAEMMGTDKESTLTRKIDQAESYRPAKPQDDEDDDEDEDGNPKKKKEEVPAGPSALVVVKEAKSPWEQMKDRLQDSPLIKELLKNSRQFRKAAVETDIGKKAEYLGKSVQDKLHDAREFWETSQNPLVYTLSGAWDNLTGETEEGIAISEIRKLDPNFNKVSIV